MSRFDLFINIYRLFRINCWPATKLYIHLIEGIPISVFVEFELSPLNVSFNVFKVVAKWQLQDTRGRLKDTRRSNSTTINIMYTNICKERWDFRTWLHHNYWKIPETITSLPCQVVIFVLLSCFYLRQVNLITCYCYFFWHSLQQF